MTTTPENSNVYYLPTEPAIVAPRAPQSGWARLRRRVARAWWRARITAEEILVVLRRPSPLVLSDEAVAFLARATPRRPRFAVPARVIDLAAARARRRPA
jgi:hypothetical protein